MLTDSIFRTLEYSPFLSAFLKAKVPDGRIPLPHLALLVLAAAKPPRESVHHRYESSAATAMHSPPPLRAARTPNAPKAASLRGGGGSRWRRQHGGEASDLPRPPPGLPAVAGGVGGGPLSLSRIPDHDGPSEEVL